ncbi:ADAMTS-like protein 2 [Haliotis cracherodii]|uniref:ADAMTS-like protein 2 n=1 Tax=Haliotis cracherodii TaxID=6455 RepID=UPI0039EB5187
MNSRQCMGILHVITVCFVFSHTGVQSRDRTKGTDHKKISCDFRWSAWSEFSPCSRSCGLGMKARHRTCYEYGPDPRPVDGKNCKGKTRDHQACNTQPCSPGSRDFRELQCSFFNGQTYRGRVHQWKAFTTRGGRGQVSDPCALMCAAEGHSAIVVKFSQRVVDGTECGSSPKRVCVAGLCVPIGCDSRPYSNKTQDHCGVCGGRNDTCHTVTKTISFRLPSGTTELLRIPVGARYVKVTERPRNGVILSLKNAQGTVSINGRSGRGHSTDTKLVAGTVVYYYHPSMGVKNIRAEGPLNDTLIVMGHARQPSRVSLWYEYTIHNTNTKTTQGVVQAGLDNPDPSYPWQSLLYNHVVSGRGMAGHKSLANPTPIVALATSTVQPSCQRKHAAIQGKVPHGKSYQRRRVGRTFETFHRMRGRGPTKSGRRKSFSRSAHRRRVHETAGRRKLSRRKESVKTVYSKMGIFKNVSRSSGNRAKKTRPFSNIAQKKGTKTWHRGFMVMKQNNTEPSQGYKTDERSAKSTLKPATTRTIQRVEPITSTPVSPGTAVNGSATVVATTVLTTGFVNVTKTKISTTPQPTDEVLMPFENVSVVNPSRRSPVEAAIPTYMPDEDPRASKEDLSIASRTLGSNSSEGESPDLQVGLSIQVATRKPEKAERRRRGRGRKRKKEDRFIWRANDVTPCTSTCEIGTTVTFFSCYQRTGERVDDRFCNGQTKPPPSHHACAGRTCKPRWVAGLWSECSESCGEGRQERTARCWQMMAPGFDSTVRDFACKPVDKPQTVRTCRKLRSCVPQWEISAWEECSTECGYGVQLRHVRCSNENEATCSTRRRPPDRRPCRNKPCINHWFTLPWSSCSGMCGVRKRKVYCRDNQGRAVDDRKCDYNTKPLTVHACGHCQNKWVPQEWGECSVTCGGGVTTRRVVCGATSRGSFHIRPDSYCIEEARPPTTTRCRTAPCGAAWYTTEWSECSESCGTTGFRYRDVRCYGGPDTEVCDAKIRPEERERCQLQPCEKEIRCEDDGETQCHLVVSAKLCSHKYYRKACCETCSMHP